MYGVCAVTAVTAQSPARVERVFPVPAREVTAQMGAVCNSVRVSAVKTGMLWSRETVRAVSRTIEKRCLRPLVVDPLIASQAGRRLINSDAEEDAVRLLLPLADLVTPNVEEAARLSGVMIERPGDLAGASRRIIALGARAVLITGFQSGKGVVDWFFDGSKDLRFISERLEGASMHGSGCVLSAAVAAGLARGLSMREAVRHARRYVRREIRCSWRVGGGVSVARHGCSSKPIRE